MDNIEILEQVVSYISLIVIGMAGATARYISDLGGEKFHKKTYLLSIVVGGIVAVFMGLATDYWNITGSLQHLVVGLGAISSKELISFAPNVVKTYAEISSKSKFNNK